MLYEDRRSRIRMMPPADIKIRFCCRRQIKHNYRGKNNNVYDVGYRRQDINCPAAPFHFSNRTGDNSCIMPAKLNTAVFSAINLTLGCRCILKRSKSRVVEKMPPVRLLMTVEALFEIRMPRRHMQPVADILQRLIHAVCIISKYGKTYQNFHIILRIHLPSLVYFIIPHNLKFRNSLRKRQELLLKNAANHVMQRRLSSSASNSSSGVW